MLVVSVFSFWFLSVSRSMSFTQIFVGFSGDEASNKTGWLKMATFFCAFSVYISDDSISGFRFDICKISTISIRYRYFVNNK